MFVSKLVKLILCINEILRVVTNTNNKVTLWYIKHNEEISSVAIYFQQEISLGWSAQRFINLDRKSMIRSHWSANKTNIESQSISFSLKNNTTTTKIYKTLKQINWPVDVCEISSHYAWSSFVLGYWPWTCRTVKL